MRTLKKLQAGLFSAVLSAFLVAIYPNLQANASDQILQVLERIATQTASYKIQSGFLNATIINNSPSPSTFQPAPSDVLVNALWFASLVVSLITASFGILVKQWLREYLAVENPSPQARLRVRHLRYPELRKWKVFEIAAALPLLLQIALGLFFLGLCFLTTSINSTVNRTTLPLVIGWAFCFVSVTLMPVLYPRCPFKTTFLKTPLQLIRRGIVLVAYVFYIIALLPTVLLWLIPRLKPDFLIPSFVARIVQRAVIGGNYETEAVLNEDADLEILAAVDAIQSNDELLRTTIAESLDQLQPSFDKALGFIIRVMQNRLQTGDLVGRLGAPTVVELRTLSRHMNDFVLELICKYFLLFWQDAGNNVIDNARMGSKEYSEISWVVAILLSPSRVSAPPTAVSIIKGVFLPNAPRFCNTLISGCYEHQIGDEYTDAPGDGRALLTIQQVRAALDALSADSGISWGCLQAILEALSSSTGVVYPTLLQHISSDCGDSIKQWLFSLIHDELRQTVAELSPTAKKALVTASELTHPTFFSLRRHIDNDFIVIFKEMLLQPSTAEFFVDTFLWPVAGTRWECVLTGKQMDLLLDVSDSGASPLH